ncbi:MAG: aminopeptidase [Cytophagales bacterium]|nr:aminopeptidase [Bernardetiaceae bacterium]MDW8204957.1 aminopeptidase [Cytophagales bacterium]
MKNYPKWILLLASLLTMLIIWQRELLAYVWMQACGQLKIIWEARPIEEVLSDATLPDSLKQKLQLIQEIRRFAEDSLGLNPSDNYTTFYDQQGKPILWTLTACPPYQLQAYEWHFPLLGSFSYKGFFDLSKAKAEERRLQAQGYDTAIEEVLGWSTLGWLKDPILSNFLQRSTGHLAELIIHELTHGTLYVPNNVEYNENLATFVGYQGALSFLRYKYGENSAEMQEYIHTTNDKKRFIAFVLQAANSLDSLYRSFPISMSEGEKAAAKQRHIAKIVQALDTVSFASDRYRNYFTDFIPNNTFFMEFMRYNRQQNVFQEEFYQKFGGNFKQYWAHLKATYPSL